MSGTAPAVPPVSSKDDSVSPSVSSLHPSLVAPASPSSPSAANTAITAITANTNPPTSASSTASNVDAAYPRWRQAASDLLHGTHQVLDPNVRYIRSGLFAAAGITSLFILSRTRGFQRYTLTSLPSDYFRRYPAPSRVLSARIKEACRTKLPKSIRKLGSASFASDQTKKVDDLLFELTPRPGRKLRGTVVAVEHLNVLPLSSALSSSSSSSSSSSASSSSSTPSSPPPAPVVHFVHMPLMRHLFTFQVKKKVTLYKETIPVRLAGLQLSKLPQATQRLEQLVHGQPLYLQCVEPIHLPPTLTSPQQQAVTGLFFARKIFRGTCINEQLLSEGWGTITPTVPSKSILQERFTGVDSAMEVAAATAKEERKGMWASHPPTISSRVGSEIRYYLQSLFRWIKFKKSAKASSSSDTSPSSESQGTCTSVSATSSGSSDSSSASS